MDAFADTHGKDNAPSEAYGAFRKKLDLIGENCLHYNEGDADYCSKAEAFRKEAHELCETKWLGVLQAVFDEGLRP